MIYVSTGRFLPCAPFYSWGFISIDPEWSAGVRHVKNGLNLEITIFAMTNFRLMLCIVVEC